MDSKQIVNKQTLIPLGIAIGLVFFFSKITYDITERFIKIETEIEYQKRTDALHMEKIIILNEQNRSLSDNLVKQSELLKSLNRSVSRLEKKLD